MSKALLEPPALAELQRQAFAYFLHETNPRLGLVADKTGDTGPASVAAVGVALAGYPVGVERGFISRHEAVSRTLAAMRFFQTAPQGTQPDATGYKGFYYHFLDMQTGKRAEGCEVSTIDTALLLAGMLVAAGYFDQEDADEAEIRQRAGVLYRRADWDWARNGGATVSHGWLPESGFLPDRWEGYCEAILLYILGLASPTHPLPAESYDAWTSTYQWKKVLGYEYLHAGPLFVHQLSHLWIDFRGIQDAFMRSKCIDYFENSRRATYAQRQYAIENPLQFAGYSDTSWGITASEGPGPATLTIHGKRRQFFGYQSREIPDGPDDGTLAPWAVAASLPFAPEIVLPALQHFEDLNLRTPHRYGFKATFNRNFPEKDRERPFWVSPYHLALNLGPVLLMIENAESGLLWRLMRSCPCIIRGLSRAGFTGGWLEGK